MDYSVGENSKKDYKRWLKRTETESKKETIEVEQVENGYIKTVSINIKSEDGWKYTSKKYISTDNPMEEKPLIDKLSETLKGLI